MWLDAHGDAATHGFMYLESRVSSHIDEINKIIVWHVIKRNYVHH